MNPRLALLVNESFAAAFADTLRLNVILPIVIMVLVMMLIKREVRLKNTPGRVVGR